MSFNKMLESMGVGKGLESTKPVSFKSWSEYICWHKQMRFDDLAISRPKKLGRSPITLSLKFASKVCLAYWIRT